MRLKDRSKVLLSDDRRIMRQQTGKVGQRLIKRFRTLNGPACANTTVLELNAWCHDVECHLSSCRQQHAVLSRNCCEDSASGPYCHPRLQHENCVQVPEPEAGINHGIHNHKIMTHLVQSSLQSPQRCRVSLLAPGRTGCVPDWGRRSAAKLGRSVTE